MDVLKDKGVLFDISDKEPMALHLVLSEEEREIYKYNTETLPYKAGQVHAMIDAVFYNYWRKNDASWSYPSYGRGIYKGLMFKLLWFDGILFEDYIHSLDFAKDIDALLAKKSVSPKDYSLILKISEVLNIETTDSRIIDEVHNEIERTTLDFFTMTVPNVLMRHKKIQEQKANSDM